MIEVIFSRSRAHRSIFPELAVEYRRFNPRRPRYPFESGPYELAIALRGCDVAARALTGASASGGRGYLSLFYADGADSGAAILNAIISKHREWGSAAVEGPVSHDYLDYGRGALCAGDPSDASALNASNPLWYESLFLDCGFSRKSEFLAYRVSLESPAASRCLEAGDWAARRFGFAFNSVGASESFACDRVRAIEDAPRLFYAARRDPVHMSLKRLGEIRGGARCAFINKNGVDAGYAVVLPDGNDRARIATACVSPRFRRGGAAVSLMAGVIRECALGGVRELDLSIIDSSNDASRRFAASAGGEISHVYRDFIRAL